MVMTGGCFFALGPATRHLAAGFQSLDFKEVQMGEKLGSGAGATVYQGEWQGRTEGGQQKVAPKDWHFLRESSKPCFKVSEWKLKINGP